MTDKEKIIHILEEHNWEKYEEDGYCIYEKEGTSSVEFNDSEKTITFIGDEGDWLTIPLNYYAFIEVMHTHQLIVNNKIVNNKIHDKDIIESAVDLTLVSKNFTIDWDDTSEFLFGNELIFYWNKREECDEDRIEFDFNTIDRILSSEGYMYEIKLLSYTNQKLYWSISDKFGLLETGGFTEFNIDDVPEIKKQFLKEIFCKFVKILQKRKE